MSIPLVSKHIVAQKDIYLSVEIALQIKAAFGLQLVTDLLKFVLCVAIQQHVLAFVCKLLLFLLSIPLLQRLQIFLDIVFTQGRVAIYPYSFLLLVKVSYSSNISTYKALSKPRLVKQYVVANFIALCLQGLCSNLLYQEKKQLVLYNSILVVVLLLLIE